MLIRLHHAVKQGSIGQVKHYLRTDNVNQTTDLTVNKHTSTLMSPLHIAAFYDRKELIYILLTYGANINQYNGDGETPCTLALTRGNYAFARCLIEKGATYDPWQLYLTLEKNLLRAVTTNDLLSIKYLHMNGFLSPELAEEALVYAAKCNALEVVQTLLAYGISADACFNDETALGMAAKYGHNEVARLLFLYGATADKYTATRWQTDCTPLRQALFHNNDIIASERFFTQQSDKNSKQKKFHSNAALIELLLDNGADPNKINQSGLIHLAKNGEPQELAILLARGLDPNTIVCQDKSLLTISIATENYTIANVLVKYGAVANGLNERQQNYLHISTSRTLTRTLIKQGVNKEQRDNQGKKPIDYAKTSVAEILFQQGASIDSLTPHSSAALGCSKIVRAMLDKSIDFSVEDAEGITPLRKMARSSYNPYYFKALKLLVKSGKVNINQQGTLDGRTVLHEIFSMPFITQNRFIIEFLITEGAQPLFDAQNCTPLMCMPYVYDLHDLKESVANYAPLEAAYHQVDSTLYEKRMLILHLKGRDFFSGNFKIRREGAIEALGEEIVQDPPAMLVP